MTAVTRPDPTSGDAADLEERVYLMYEQVGHLDLLIAIQPDDPRWKSWMETATRWLPKYMIRDVIAAEAAATAANQAVRDYLQATNQPRPRPS